METQVIEKTENTVTKKKMSVKKKIIILIFAVILPLAILLTAFFSRNLIRTVASVKKISNAPAYQMNYYGSYELDKYLQHGVSNADEYRSFLSTTLAGGACTFFGGAHGCSAFFAKTPDGDLILARNLDTTVGKGCVLKTDGTDGSKVLAMSNLEWIWYNENEPYEPKDELTFSNKLMSIASPYAVTDGMNEYGLTVSLFSADGSHSTIDENKTNLLDYSIPIVLLNKAKTVDEAIEVLSKYNVVMSEYPEHFMVSDASGDSAIIEYVNGKMQVTRINGNYQICTNFIIYNNPKLEGFGNDRYKNYDDALSKTNGVISTDDALKLLQKNTIPGDEQWSVVYNLTDKTMSATFYKDYDHVYTYSFDS